MNTKNNKSLLLQFVLISICFILLSFNCRSYAQADLLAKKTVKQSNVFLVLGRELTSQERDLYSDATIEELKNLLPNEQKLVVVRALIGIGQAQCIDLVLNSMPITEPKPYNKLVEYFKELQGEYGSVCTAIKAKFVENNNDKQYAFEQAALKAYETIYGVKPLKEDEPQLFTFFKQDSDVKELTYEEMIKKLKDILSDKDKQEIIFSALDKIGRPDLKSNENFVKKLLEQDFTYESLIELFQPLKAQPQAPKATTTKTTPKKPSKKL